MRIVGLAHLPARPVHAHGSHGFTVAGLSRAAHVVTMTLAAGGHIGRHDAVVDQLLVVVSGSALVAGADDVEHRIGPGQGALWEAGEAHRTRAETDVVALAVEAEGLAAALA